MIMQFFFGYLVNRYLARQRFHLVDKLITAREFNAHVQPARTKYARTILMTKFASRALYAVPRVQVKSEVYFGLKGHANLVKGGYATFLLNT